MILIITSIRTSYLTFYVHVISGRETWPLTLTEEPRQRVSRRILTEGWKNLHNGMHNLWSSAYTLQ